MACRGRLVRCFFVGSFSRFQRGVVELLEVPPFELSVLNEVRRTMLEKHCEGEGGPEENKQPEKQAEKTHKEKLRVAQKCSSGNWLFLGRLIPTRHFPGPMGCLKRQVPSRSGRRAGLRA